MVLLVVSPKPQQQTPSLDVEKKVEVKRKVIQYIEQANWLHRTRSIFPPHQVQQQEIDHLLSLIFFRKKKIFYSYFHVEMLRNLHLTNLKDHITSSKSDAKRSFWLAASQEFVEKKPIKKGVFGNKSIDILSLENLILQATSQ